MSVARPMIEFGGRKIVVDLPHLAFATGIAGWSAWFCRDAWLSGPDIENLILIVPASAMAVALYIFVAAGCFHVAGKTEKLAATPQHVPAKGTGFKVAGTMVLLAGFVIAGPLIGFDVASFAYIFAMLVLLGERRIIVLLLVPLLFCVAAIYCFNTILATPLPLYFFSGDAS